MNKIKRGLSTFRLRIIKGFSIYFIITSLSEQKKKLLILSKSVYNFIPLPRDLLPGFIIHKFFYPTIELYLHNLFNFSNIRIAILLSSLRSFSQISQAFVFGMTFSLSISKL